jgi:hypothetical protein
MNPQTQAYIDWIKSNGATGVRVIPAPSANGGIVVTPSTIPSNLDPATKTVIQQAIANGSTNVTVTGPNGQTITVTTVPRPDPFNRTGDKTSKKLGGILRYPYEALTNETDYLQIDIREYQSIKASTGGLVSGRSIRQNQINSDAPGGFLPVKDTTTSKLSTKKAKGAIGTILLPMPSNIQDGNSVNFSSSNLDGLTAGIFNTIQTSQVTNPQQTGNAIQQMIGNATTTANNLAGFFGNNVGAFSQILSANIFSQAANIPLGGSLTRDAVFARSSGEILNQNVELLFNGVTLRSFKFSFKMTPRNENEARQIKLIINAFKQNMAAKLGGQEVNETKNGKTISASNVFLKSPNVFELTYKQGSRKHPFLHSFKQCVLTDMSVNYTGEGVYATYAGQQGSPVSMVLELGFKELEPIYDLDYDDPIASIGVGY